MSRLEKLRESRSSISVQFMDFMKAVSRDRSILTCFFEGEDEKYFSVRINTILPGVKWVGIDCGGKSNVISLRNKIRTHAQYKKSYAAFFIDNDFGDDTVNDREDFYITSCYSVENCYASIETFKNILSAEFGMSECCSQTNDFDMAVSIFSERLLEFCNEILPFNIWIKAHRVIEKSTPDKSKALNLNNIKIDDLVLISLSKVSSVYDSENISDLFSNTFPITSEDYVSSEAYFIQEGRPLESLLRGKQQLDFLRIFLTQLREERSKKSGSMFSKRTPVKLQLSKANMLSELSQYAVTPTCLVNYLNSLSYAA